MNLHDYGYCIRVMPFVSRNWRVTKPFHLHGLNHSILPHLNTIADMYLNQGLCINLSILNHSKFICEMESENNDTGEWSIKIQHLYPFRNRSLSAPALIKITPGMTFQELYHCSLGLA